MATKTIEIADKPTLDEINSKVKQIINGNTSGIASGIIPPDVSFSVLNGDEYCTLQWSVAAKTIVEGQTICNTAGVMIRRSTEGTPETENDGDLVTISSNLEGSYEDTGLANGTVYYYHCFPYSDHELYNRGSSGTGSCTPSHTTKVVISFTATEAIGGVITAIQDEQSVSATVDDKCIATLELPTIGVWKVGGQDVAVSRLGENISLTERIYGYDWTLSESDPETAITYPNSVDNAKFTAVQKRGADATIELGDWQVFHDWTGCRPVMLNFDGTVLEELKPDNQTYTADGAASHVADSTVSANAMVEVPKRYFKRWTDESLVAHFRVSRIKLGDDWKCYQWNYGNTEDSLTENDYIYMPMFEGSSVSSKVRSIAGQTPMNTNAGATELTQIQALGDGWIFDDWSDEVMITDYMIMMGRSTDVQAHWGNGHYSGGSQASNLLATGGLKDKGPYYGGTGNSYMKFMWLENYFGDRWTRSMGVWYINSILYIKMYPPYTTDGTVGYYKNIGRGISGTTGGYISDLTYDENGMVPKTVSGSETTYWPDGDWFANGTEFLIWGGDCSDGLHVGAAFNVNNPFSYSGWFLGPSPAYKCPVKAA